MVRRPGSRTCRSSPHTLTRTACIPAGISCHHEAWSGLQRALEDVPAPYAHASVREGSTYSERALTQKPPGIWSPRLSNTNKSKQHSQKLERLRDLQRRYALILLVRCRMVIQYAHSKVITMAKKGRLADYTRASGFLLRPQLTPKLFTTLAERYRDRPGGYTRIHKFGNRPGDNAPHAILEFVDNPRDLKYEVTARAVGWEVLGKEMQERSAKTLAAEGINGITELMQKELTLDPDAQGELRTRTRWNLQKVVKYRPASALSEIGLKAEGHIVRKAVTGPFSGASCSFTRIPYWPNPWLSRHCANMPTRRLPTHLRPTRLTSEASRTSK